MRAMMRPATTRRTGTATAMIQARLAACSIARTMPPTASRGADTRKVAPIMASICTCCTSLVLRVMSDPGPNPVTSRSEKLETRSKMPSRRSRPMRIAAFAAK